jgi:hypothetical protein
MVFEVRSACRDEPYDGTLTDALRPVLVLDLDPAVGTP